MFGAHEEPLTDQLAAGDFVFMPNRMILYATLLCSPVELPLRRVPLTKQMMATSVVLATLSILPYERALFGRTDDLSHEQEKERTIRMATILGFTVVRGRGAGWRMRGPADSLTCWGGDHSALSARGRAAGGVGATLGFGNGNNNI